MAEKYFQAIGRRKTAIAQVRLYPGGSGTITVNDKPYDAFFTTPTLRAAVLRPLKEAGKATAVNVTVKTVGGGPTGQADATKLGIARALVMYDEALKPSLKAHSLLTRDPRKKERKKFGKHGARRSPQWRKR
ncbi:30S ribosomal protein S9 [Candidatus Uhrbacteria bacterium]|nr:30S ribosomal protein S9 [Candidatus Uhrbacteria bacterium]